MASDSVIGELLAIKERLELPDPALAGLCGVSVSTVRVARLTRKLPPSPKCRGRFSAFVDMNRDAQDRTQLRLVPW